MQNILASLPGDISSSTPVRKKGAKTIPDELINSVEYDSESGEMKWLATGRGRRRDRKIMSRHYKTQHIYLCFKGKKYLVHRVAWTIVHGEIPDGIEIDHKNRTPYDNRLDNLRMASCAQNHANARIKKNSTNGYKGIYKNGPSWSASIMKNYTKYHLGSFPTREEAHAAYARATEELNKQFAFAG